MKLTDKEFERLRDYMYEKFGINLAQKRVLIEGRLSMPLQKRGYTDFTSYINDMMRDTTGKEVSLLVEKLTTNFTYFLREEGHYDFMVKNVLPDFKGKAGSELKIWSAASSSGEEAYSIAMVCDNYFGPGRLNRVSIMASDISSFVLEQAKAGVYDQERISKLPADWVKRYFTKTESGEFKVNTSISRGVTFKYFNLNANLDWPKRTYDVIFCRNVMIYFDQPTRLALTAKLHEALKPGGYMFIGMSETLVNLKTEFEYVKPSIYKRKA